MLTVDREPISVIDYPPCRLRALVKGSYGSVRTLFGRCKKVINQTHVLTTYGPIDVVSVHAHVLTPQHLDRCERSHYSYMACRRITCAGCVR
jgi:hypothetical protein